MDESEAAPVRKARKVMLIALGGIIVALLIMLAIVLLRGDPTNDLGDQPSQAAVFGGSVSVT